MLNFLVKNEIIDSFPKIPILKEETSKIEIIKKPNLIRILDYSKTLSNQSELIIRLLISTGIRTTELTFIKKENIDLNSNSIYLEYTKSGEPRYIFFDEYTKNLIIEAISSENKKNSFLLVNSKTHEHLEANAVRCILKKIKKKLDIEKLSPHKFRHTYGTFLLENGADLESVRLLLGHKTYDMTKRYMHLTNKRLKTVNNQFNVLNFIETN